MRLGQEHQGFWDEITTLGMSFNAGERAVDPTLVCAVC